MPRAVLPLTVRHGLLWSLGLLLGLAGCSDPRQLIEAGVVLEGVAILDGTGAPLLPNQAVVLRDGRIAAMGEVGAFRYGSQVEVRDLRGRYLLPGFIDVHAHATILPLQADGSVAARMDTALSARVLRLLLAHGITTLRNPAAPTADGLALRQAVADGRILGPRIVTAGAALNPTAAAFGPFVAVRTEAEVRAEVRRQAEAGVDAIKVYAALPPALVAAAIDEAHRQGVPVIGHLQRTTWTEAARFGIDAITHGAPWSAATLPADQRAGYRGTMTGRLYWLEHIALDGPEIDTMVTAMAARGVTVDPTLIAYHTKFWGDDPRYLAHPDLPLVPSAILRGWQRIPFTDGWTAATFRRARATWPTVLALTRRLYDAGVLLTVGSDTPNPWVIPGVGWHEELQLLAEAGIPASAVITMATANGARALGLGDEVGTVAVGRRADLVVLTANPLDDLRHTRAIEWVIHEGVFHRPADLLAPD